MKSIFLILYIFSVAVNGNKISEANNRFAPDVYKELTKSDSGNILFSPLSAETVLAFLLSGTEGDTAQELSKALYLPESKEEVKNETRSLLASLQSDGATTFKIANAAFIQQNAVLKEPFLKAAKDDFYASSQNVDFSKNQEAANVINKYVEDNTNDLIKDLVSPDALSAATLFVLVNALYFKGNWSTQFSKSDTTKDAFYAPNEVVQVDTLHHHRKHFNYYACEDLEAQFLELPFQGGEASMVIALPNARTGLAELEKSIVDIATYEIPFESTYLDVALPKFKFEYKIDFKKVLSQLGVKKIFNPAEADLSGIAGEKGDLVVSDVIQKAFMDLNEGGVEAAAATYVAEC